MNFMLLTVEVDFLLELSCDEVYPLSHLALSALNGIFNMNMANEIHVTLIYKYSLSPKYQLMYFNNDVLSRAFK